jgi:hypothetical protein
LAENILKNPESAWKTAVVVKNKTRICEVLDERDRKKPRPE